MQKYLTFLFSILIGLLTVSFSAENSLAVSPVIHKSPAPSWILQRKSYDKKPSARTIQNGAYDELVEEQINVDLQATYNHIITDIVSKSGVQDNSEISVSFDPSYEKLISMRSLYGEIINR